MFVRNFQLRYIASGRFLNCIKILRLDFAKNDFYDFQTSNDSQINNENFSNKNFLAPRLWWAPDQIWNKLDLFFSTTVILSCLLIQICNSQTDNSKWTWGSSRSRSDNFRAINGEKRYNGALVGASKGLFQANSNYNGVREWVDYQTLIRILFQAMSLLNQRKLLQTAAIKKKKKKENEFIFFFRSANLLYRYEVTEDPSTSDYTTYRPLPTQQYRPDPNRPNPNRPVNPYRPPPDFVRPTNTLVNNYRPTNRSVRLAGFIFNAFSKIR